jgi:thiamine pyrophosphokinase
MNFPIVSSDAPIILVGAGQLYPNDLTDSLTYSQRIIAADGGAAAVLAAGHIPEIVIGDMDSVPNDTRLEGRIHQIAEQDSTDFDKALRSVSAPLVLALGFTGRRLDHGLAVMTSLARAPQSACIVVGEESIVFLCPPLLDMDLPRDSVFSLFPMAQLSATSQGLKYPLNGLTFAPDAQIGTSNAVTGPVRVVPSDPKMLVILPRAALAQVIKLLQQSGAKWPALA